MPSTMEAMRETLVDAATALNAANEEEVRGLWLEIVRLQEAIDTACLLHAPGE